jgi:Putative adhesin
VTRRETFPTPEPIRLDLSVAAGEIAVDSGDLHVTTVELEPLGGSDSVAAVEEARVELRDGVLVVDVPERRGIRFLGRGPEVRLAVRCPHGCDLRARAASADVRASGRFSAADVESASGDVSVEDVAGDARVKSASGDVEVAVVGGMLTADAASGDIEIERVDGNARIRTASGDVKVGEAGASIAVQTASGDQRIGSVAKGEVSLRSASGDLWVGVRRGSAVWVDASSMSGDTTSELDVGAAPASTGAAEEGPLVELRAQSMSGDIHVARAAASSASDLGR